MVVNYICPTYEYLINQTLHGGVRIIKSRSFYPKSKYGSQFKIARNKLTITCFDN